MAFAAWLYGSLTLGWRRRYRDPKFPSCPEETKQRLLSTLREYAMKGADWAKQALSLRPCELWQHIQGRTVWMAGDSVTQVGFLKSHQTTAQQPHQPKNWLQLRPEVISERAPDTPFLTLPCHNSPQCM